MRSDSLWIEPPIDPPDYEELRKQVEAHEANALRLATRINEERSRHLKDAADLLHDLEDAKAMLRTVVEIGQLPEGR